VTVPFTGDPGAQGLAAGRLRDIEAVTDAALSRLDEQALLRALLGRVKKVFQADTAAVLLLDGPAGPPDGAPAAAPTSGTRQLSR
jgi:hypothetical protein